MIGDKQKRFIDAINAKITLMEKQEMESEKLGFRSGALQIFNRKEGIEIALAIYKEIYQEYEGE